MTDTRHPLDELAGRLAVFSSLARLIGVAFGRLALAEPISAIFVGAAVLVGAGIALVNLPALRETGGAAPAPS